MYPCCCCCSHINSHNQVRGHRTGSSHSGAEEYPRENTHTTQARWYTHISQLTQFMPPPETYKSEIGSQSTMCQVQAGPYVSLLTPGGTKYSDCHPSNTTMYILHVLIVSITTHAHVAWSSSSHHPQKPKKRQCASTARLAALILLLACILCYNTCYGCRRDLALAARQLARICRKRVRVGGRRRRRRSNTTTKGLKSTVKRQKLTFRLQRS